MTNMRDAVIVSTARTPIGRAYRGAFNATPPPTLAAHAISAAVERSGIDPAAVDDCIIGCAMRSEEHTSELQSLMRSSYAVLCLKKKNTQHDATPAPHPSNRQVLLHALHSDCNIYNNNLGA